jgi:hypothetical protein
MKHDLDAINAALRLGDKFVPPNGSVCRCRDDNGIEFTCKIIVLVLDGKSYIKTATPSSFGYFRDPGDILEIISVPKWALSFGEWARI